MQQVICICLYVRVSMHLLLLELDEAVTARCAALLALHMPEEILSSNLTERREQLHDHVPKHHD